MFFALLAVGMLAGLITALVMCCRVASDASRDVVEPEARGSELELAELEDDSSSVSAGTTGPSVLGASAGSFVDDVD